MNDKPVATLDEIRQRLDSGNHWNLPVIGYAFTDQPPSEGFAGQEQQGLSLMNDEQQQAVHLAMTAWEDLIPIALTEASDATAEILLSNFAYTYVAYAYLPPDGDIFVNPKTDSNQELGYGDYGYHTLIHEIGHALGLNHPGAYDSIDGYRFDYASQADYQQDSLQYTVMSYWEAENTGALHRGQFPSTPLLHDIAAIQAIYGENTQIRSDNTVYGFNSNTNKDVYDFSLYNQPVLCLWDPEGIDTLDLSGYLYDSIANLNPGSFSDVGGLQKNLSIAFNTQIENLIGGFGNDVLIGQDADNQIIGGAGDDVLQGNLGNDWLIGGDGIDTALYSACPDDYTLSVLASDGYYQITGPDGTDKLESLEWLQFADGTVIDLSTATNLTSSAALPTFDSLQSILYLPHVLSSDGTVFAPVTLYLNFTDHQLQLRQASQNSLISPAFNDKTWSHYDFSSGLLTIPEILVDEQLNFLDVQIQLDFIESSFDLIQAIPAMSDVFV